MKKILGLALVLLFLGTVSTASANRWKLSINGGVDILASGLQSNNVGAGLGLGVGMAVNDNWSFWLNSNAFYDFASTSLVTDVFDEAILSAKYTFAGAGGVNPYLRAGLGIYYDSLTVSFLGISVTGTSSNFMLQGGVGLEFPAGTGLSFFVEADGGLVLATGTTGVTVPATVGVIIDL